MEDGDGVAEALEVFNEAVVLVFEDQLAEALDGVGGEFDVVFSGEFDEGLKANRAVEVDMEVSLGEFLDKFAADVEVHRDIPLYKVGLP